MKNLLLAAALLVFGASGALALDSDCPNRVVTFHNDSSQVIGTIQLKGRDSRTWSGNYLSDFDLYPGDHVQIDGDYAPGSGAGYHIFYFYAEGYDGGRWRDSLDMCVQSDWYLTD